MANVTLAHQPLADASGIGQRRVQLHFDLRWNGPALAAIARSRCMSTSALAKSVLCEWLMTQSVDSTPDGAAGMQPDGSVPLRHKASSASLSLRMPADRAAELVRAARAAELPLGRYVVQLLHAPSAEDPPSASPRALASAMVRSNAMLAAWHGDLKALARALKQASSPEQEADQEVLVSRLIAEVGQHLASTAPQIAALPASWRRQVGKPD